MALLRFEELESRYVLTSALSWPGLIHPVREMDPNDTQDQAQSLGDVGLPGRLEVIGNIGGFGGAAEVDWYTFALNHAARVTLATLDRPANSPFISVLSLYDSGTANPHDPYNPLGKRLLAQDDGAFRSGDARIERSLAPGVYYVAVSGSGNRYFHPLIAGSGYPGSTGDYGLQINAVDLDLRPDDGPAALATDPAPEAELDRSPFVLRIDLSEALDPNSVVLGGNIRLVENAGGRFGDGSDESVSLTQFNFDAAVNELQLYPASPLRPGYYRLTLAGDSLPDPHVLRDSSGQPLGKDARHSSGYDFATRFRINGVKGNRSATASASDTPATAYELGNLVQAGSLEIAGAIGIDPTDPMPFSPADVSMYHFNIEGGGRFAFGAEVFAGRIGSPLNPALSLFRLDPTTGALLLLAANDDTFNDTPTHTHDSLPLFTDSAVSLGLTAGDYYLAVSSSGNMPDPVHGLLPGTNGIFDPRVSHSGRLGDTTGPYVLSLAITADNSPPRIYSVAVPGSGELRDAMVLGSPPSGLLVDFNKPVNLTQLALQAFLASHQGRLDAIYIRAADGHRYYPRFQKLTDNGRHAEFLMPDALPNGAYALHFSGALGLTDFAGNPLAANDPASDYVVTFSVDGPARGFNGNPLMRSSQEPNHSPSEAQDLGTFFPNEVQKGIMIVRDYTATSANVSASSADYYRFTVLQATHYRFTLNGSGTSADIRLSVKDTSGRPVFSDSFPSGGFPLFVDLPPGRYTVGLEGWSPDEASGVVYQFSIWSGGQDPEPPPPLTIGPGPALRFRPIPGGPPPLPALPPIQTAQSSVLPPTVLGASSSERVTTSLPPSAPANAGIRDLGNIPSSLILALAFGPKGGVSSDAGVLPLPKTDIYERLFLRLPDPTLTESLLRLPILLQTGHSGTSETAAGAHGLAALLGEIYRRMNKAPLRRVFDFLYQYDAPSRPLNSPATQTRDPEPVDRSKTGKPENDADDLAPEQTVAAPGLLALFAAGLLARPNGKRKRRGSTWPCPEWLPLPRN